MIGIDVRRQLSSVTGKISLMRKVERVTEMQNPCTGVRTDGMRECRDHLYPSCDSVDAPKIAGRLMKIYIGNFRGQVCLAEDEAEIENRFLKGRKKWYP